MAQVPLGIPTPRIQSGSAAAAARANDPSRPAVPGLVDTHGRVAKDLRVSLTDKCNLRCEYCMPAEGFEWLPGSEVLSDDEVIRLLTIAVQRLGVREARFTGGEPLMRKGLERIIAATTQLRTDEGLVPQTSLTTNGLGLEHRVTALAEAGLARINVSLDSINRETYAAITRRDRLPAVLTALESAKSAGLNPIKINAVLMRGRNEHEATQLLDFALRNGFELRFIEQMPLGPADSWERGGMVTADEILSTLSANFDLTADDPAARGAAPAQRWTVAPSGDRPGGRVGIIASVTRPFCGACDRTRLTADGQMRTCLFSRSETDLRGLMRDGADDETLAQAWREAMWGKLPGHGIDDPDFLQPGRPMSAIGG